MGDCKHGKRPTLARMETDSPVRRILIVDDDPLIRTTLSAALASHGYASASFSDPWTAAAVADGEAVLLDAGLPECSLSECLTLLTRRRDGSQRPILVMSGSLSRPAELAGTGIGYLTKPIPLQEFYDAVDALVEPDAKT
jgi:DNA-binding response OmpR family regulator